MEFNLDQISNMILAYAPRVIGAILTLIIGFWIVGWITRVVRRTMDRRHIDPTVQPFLASLLNVGLKVLILLSVASMFGIETTSFIAIFSALAFAVGLALQGSLGHFASGVLLLVFRPYKVGDLVDLSGKVGTVEEIQVFNTILRTLDNKKIIIPNGVVTGGVITNISGQETIGVEFTFGISYESSIDLARDTILKVAKECPFILEEPAYGVVVASWGDSSVNLASRPFCKSEHYWDTYFYMYEHVKKAFDREGISIPFPQMDVHMQKL